MGADLSLINKGGLFCNVFFSPQFLNFFILPPSYLINGFKLKGFQYLQGISVGRYRPLNLSCDEFVPPLYIGSGTTYFWKHPASGYFFYLIKKGGLAFFLILVDVLSDMLCFNIFFHSSLFKSICGKSSLVLLIRHGI